MSNPADFITSTLRDWLALQPTYGTAQPEIVVFAQNVEIPRQAIVIHYTDTEADLSVARISTSVTLVLNQSDFSEAQHRDASYALRQRLTPSPPQYDPGRQVVTAHPDLLAWSASRPVAGFLFDLVDPRDSHTFQDGRLVYLLEFTAIVIP